MRTSNLEFQRRANPPTMPVVGMNSKERSLRDLEIEEMRLGEENLTSERKKEGGLMH